MLNKIHLLVSTLLIPCTNGSHRIKTNAFGPDNKSTTKIAKGRFCQQSHDMTHLKKPRPVGVERSYTNAKMRDKLCRVTIKLLRSRRFLSSTLFRRDEQTLPRTTVFQLGSLANRQLGFAYSRGTSQCPKPS